MRLEASTRRQPSWHIAMPERGPQESIATDSGCASPGNWALRRPIPSALAGCCLATLAASGCGQGPTEGSAATTMTASGGSPSLSSLGGSPTGLVGSGGASMSGGPATGSNLAGAGGQAIGGTSALGAATAGGQTGGSEQSPEIPCTEPVTGANTHLGAYDYETCSVCHTDLWGGWLYDSPVGDSWIGGATITLTHDDGSTVTAASADDGFFSFEGTIGSSYTPCVSKCPDTVCAPEKHTSPDCQASGCHGRKDHLIHLPQIPVAAPPTGVDCEPPASGGARVHAAWDFDSDYQSCRICHDETYTGGYVYDGLTSATVVAQATVTITPANGTPIKAVTGPGGMFFLGEVGPPPSKRLPLTAPYTACVSKCPDTVCSLPGTHPTADNCGDCHNEELRIHLP